jgi:16S rRNA (cytosine967-C5)-methyltransferase
LAIVLAKLKDLSPARLAAYDVLRQVEDGAFSSVLLASIEPTLQPVDRALCHELVMGVLRWQFHLDRIAEYYSKRKVESLDVPVRIAVRLGLYQLRFLTRIPASAAVNESVSLVRSVRLSSATAFVNAVLRRATREPEYDPALEVEDPLERIAVQTSHPVWLIKRWTTSFGLAEAESFARANNVTPPTCFRVVRSRADQTEILRKLAAAGAKLEASTIVDGAWRVSGAASLLRELSTTGQIYLQDEASQLVAQALNVKPHEQVLDLCAAPGGKTSLIADRTEDRATVVASDISPQRMATVRKTAELHKLKSIRSVLVDAADPLPFKVDAFDRVLVDAPCSGTGTLRRNPEIRMRISARDITTLSARQRLFLANAANVVKAGGRLVYSTCSVEREENEDVVRDFLRRDHRFRQVPVLKEDACTMRTWPQHDGSDGFFIAAFERFEKRQARQTAVE